MSAFDPKRTFASRLLPRSLTRNPISSVANPCCNRALFGVVPALVKAMRRRDFIKVIGGSTAAWPLAARAQQPAGKIHRIGLLTRKTDASVANQINAFRHGLRDLGWVEGTSISIEYRDAEGQLDRLRALAAELVALNMDVIVTVDTPPTQAAKQD